MADDTESFDDAWDRMSEAADDAADEQPEAGGVIELGPPIRITVIIRADAVPVAPWPEGWRVAAGGPVEGHVTLVFEHELDDSPVAQLSAVTGILATLKNARLEPVWWLVQTRGPLDGESEADDLDDELAQLLGPDA